MPSLKLLFGLLTPAEGGHTRTALALADVLRQRGHDVSFVVSAATDTPGRPAAGTAALLRAGGFAVYRVTDPYATFGRPSFRESLRALVRREAFDALHWFEIHAGVRGAALVAASERCAFMWTVTSGGVPGGYYGLNRVAVYTSEVAADVQRRSPRTEVHVLPARIDFRPLDATYVASARTTIRARYGVGDEDLLVVRVARCAGVYLRSIRAGVALARRLNASGRRAVFLHAGYVEDVEAADEIRRVVDDANRTAERVFAHSVTGDLDAGTRYAAAADVCIASGRSAIESLALGRPTLVAWGSRVLGLVDDTNIEAMAGTNFQGRDAAKVPSDEAMAAGMERALAARLSAPAEERARVHEACARFVRARYSVERAAEIYEALYGDRTVTVEGGLACYGNVRHVGREVFYRLPSGLRYSRAVNFLRRTQWWPGLAGTD